MDFSQKAWNLCKKVPKGSVTTYKEIAKALNCKAYRAVGNALNKNRDSKVPCHRVVKSNGEIGGFSRGAGKKIKILEMENIEIKNKKIVNFKRILHRF